MSNIRTLKDLESGPNKQPLPNPWQTHPNASRASSYATQQPTTSYSPNSYGGGGDYGNYNQSMRYQYMGFDGYPHDMNVTQQPTMTQICCGNCCPCCVPPLCSPDKQKQWVNFVKSFCFFISIVQIIMFIIELSMGGVVSTEINPLIGPDAGTMINLGAKDGYLERFHFQVFRFITPIFLHAGFIHILFNLFVQLRTGIYLERQWGIPKFVLFYFISGIAGNLFSSLVEFWSISVGASGAIMGIMGAHFAELLWAGDRMNPQQRKISMGSAILFIVITMLFSFSKFIDWAAHLMGVIMGFLLGSVVFGKDSSNNAMRRFGYLLALAIIVSFFVIGFALFFTVVPAK
eukprot:TRINITY_DN3983_c0_g1_i2.p1 TRINITY_DN3983_c0_g1~~TRINITY_DN3983_c0_g1_i2.p1  ORF type:complete len:346 (-),score=57.34 TRINITY_DN3983_c0_g1_i2:88-1125(-)